MSDPHANDFLVAEARDDLPVTRTKLKKDRNTLARMEIALGVTELKKYHHLAKSEFIQHRMNAHAIKIRLRDRLRARKFELDRVERSVRRQQFNERKIRAHTQDSVQRRESGIQSLVTKYNSLCKKMADLIARHKAPRNAQTPHPISPGGIWALDVDDEIWQDLGLDEDSETQYPPPWLSNELVRQGIKGILLRDRAEEELRRLKNERRALYEWMAEEWLVVKMTISSLSSRPGMMQYNNICRKCTDYGLKLMLICSIRLTSEKKNCFSCVSTGEMTFKVVHQIIVSQPGDHPIQNWRQWRWKWEVKQWILWKMMKMIEVTEILLNWKKKKLSMILVLWNIWML